MVSSSETITGDPLFSCIVTLSVLTLLYFPHGFSLLFSPVLVLTASLLLSLLRLGATQRIQTEEKGSAARVAELEEEEETEPAPVELKWAACKNDPDPDLDLTKRSLEERFVEWDVRAPLDVIYEEFEGDEEGKYPNLDQTRGIERYSSLSLYYPETDSDSDSSSSSSSEMDFPAMGKWVSWEEEDREGMIEIALDKREIDFHGEDDNLIEIDIS
ncbi:hypothetical protein V6N13_084571 [Hibiscus sabdariffa]|uniref:Uncharacterized protein n=1 Tax=Hibiscus sabdariffa TaxID=183260 RepID=A0ABR2T281_9ROSI